MASLPAAAAHGKTAGDATRISGKLIQYLTKDSSTGGLPEVVNIADLPDELQQEVRALQSRWPRISCRCKYATDLTFNC